MTEVLRQCRDCNTKALSYKDLEKFRKSRGCKYGRDNLCKDCCNRRKREHYKNTSHLRPKYKKKKIVRDPIKLKAWSQAKKVMMYIACELCYSNNNLKRYFPDYSKPTEFLTLCSVCHSKILRHFKLIKRFEHT